MVRNKKDVSLSELMAQSWFIWCVMFFKLYIIDKVKK
jgi:hypothetical protein